MERVAWKLWHDQPDWQSILHQPAGVLRRSGLQRRLADDAVPLPCERRECCMVFMGAVFHHPPLDEWVPAHSDPPLRHITSAMRWIRLLRDDCAIGAKLLPSGRRAVWVGPLVRLVYVHVQPPGESDPDSNLHQPATRLQWPHMPGATLRD